ncbi:MAG: cold shock domain-containing protein [Pirellulales bacterium]
MRVGVVVKVIDDKKVGFIRSEDLREDVFFHFSKVEKSAGNFDLMEGDEVEYEIDELHRINKSERLRATLVRKSKRPLSVRIRPGDNPKLQAKHHPNARKRRPVWRNKQQPGDCDSESPSSEQERAED